MNVPSELLARCHINSNNDGDCFVGIKADSEDAVVCFPIGYNLPNTDQDLRQDILHLISMLTEFTDRMDTISLTNRSATRQSTEFPIVAYMYVISYFLMQKGYYVEKEPEFKDGSRGKIDWPKTLRKKRPLIQSNGTPAYTKYIVRVSSPNDKNLITQIHKYCVYESFTKLGWLFTPNLPEKPTISRNDKMFLMILRDKLANTYNDNDKRLLLSMIAMIEYFDEKAIERQFYYGTNQFEYVWEKLIDRVFGVKNKQNYFPKTRWVIRNGKSKINSALEPDTIMLHDNNLFVIDAKYYRFGHSGYPNDLPESRSINKQITYGEYIHSQQRFRDEYGKDLAVYNAFVMPYNMIDNPFGSSENYINIGEATGDWKTSGCKYEHVQGILVDVRHLMYHYIGDQKKQILLLAQAIESAFIDNGGLLPGNAV